LRVGCGDAQIGPPGVLHVPGGDDLVGQCRSRGCWARRSRCPARSPRSGDQRLPGWGCPPPCR
jgi:hypothetical protein